MGRGKLPQRLIPNARARRISYEKRKKCLMKKAREFSVLCDVDTCVVLYPEASTAPEVWPPDSMEARRIIERYRSAGSRAALVDPKKKKNMQLHLSGAGDLLTDPSESQLRSLLSTLDNRVDQAKRKLAAMRKDRRIATADTSSNEGLSVDAVSQMTPHRVRAASTPEWVTGAQPDAQCSSSVNGWDTMAMEDDSTFEKFLLETILL